MITLYMYKCMDTNCSVYSQVGAYFGKLHLLCNIVSAVHHALICTFSNGKKKRSVSDVFVGFSDMFFV